MFSERAQYLLIAQRNVTNTVLKQQQQTLWYYDFVGSVVTSRYQIYVKFNLDITASDKFYK